VEYAAFEKLQAKIAQMLEHCVELQNEKKRLEQLEIQRVFEVKELKKRLEHAAQERSILKQRLSKVVEHIDSLNLT
jgi:TolA-binding protein